MIKINKRAEMAFLSVLCLLSALFYFGKIDLLMFLSGSVFAHFICEEWDCRHSYFDLAGILVIYFSSYKWNSILLFAYVLIALSLRLILDRRDLKFSQLYIWLGAIFVAGPIPLLDEYRWAILFTWVGLALLRWPIKILAIEEKDLGPLQIFYFISVAIFLENKIEASSAVLASGFAVMSILGLLQKMNMIYAISLASFFWIVMGQSDEFSFSLMASMLPLNGNFVWGWASFFLYSPQLPQDGESIKWLGLVLVLVLFSIQQRNLFFKKIWQDIGLYRVSAILIVALVFNRSLLTKFETSEEQWVYVGLGVAALLPLLISFLNFKGYLKGIKNAERSLLMTSASSSQQSVETDRIAPIFENLSGDRDGLEVRWVVFILVLGLISGSIAWIF